MDTIGWPAATVCRTSVGAVIARHIYINYVLFPWLGLLCKWPFCRVGCQRALTLPIRPPFGRRSLSACKRRFSSAAGASSPSNIYQSADR